MNVGVPHRVIYQLRSCALLPGRPSFIPKVKRLYGTKAKGITYEKKIGRRLGSLWPVVSGQWFEFRDANGLGCCQTDHYVVLDDQVLLVECKLTETWVGFSQIDLLYRPILEAVYGKPVTGVMACKHLTTRVNPRLITDVRSALRVPGANFVWHCLA